MSSIFILCLDSLADYKGHFSGLWIWVFWGKISDICEEMLEFGDPLPRHTPGASVRREHPGTPCLQSKVKSHQAELHIPTFFMESGNRWRRQRHSNHVSNTNQREETKAAIPTLVFLLLEDVPALQHLFKKLNKPMEISWLLAWQGIPEGWSCRRVRGWGELGKAGWFLSLKQNLCLKQEQEPQITDYKTEHKSGKSENNNNFVQVFSC